MLDPAEESVGRESPDPDNTERHPDENKEDSDYIEEIDEEDLDIDLAADFDEGGQLAADENVSAGELEATMNSAVGVGSDQKIKRPSSAWMLYMNENRQRLKKDQPSLSIGEVAKVLSAEYKNLSQDLLEVYLELARKDKERYAQEMAAQRSLGYAPGGSNGVSYAPIAPGETIFPLARVKKTMKCDPAVKNVQKEALSVVTKATELFVAYVARSCADIAAKRGVKTIKSTDFVKAIHDDDILCFLAEDFPLSSLKAKANNKRNLGETDDVTLELNKKRKAVPPVASEKSSLLNYFGDNKEH